MSGPDSALASPFTYNLKPDLHPSLPLPTSFDIFDRDKIFCPVNLGNTHWCMAVIFMQEKRIQYYDSMGGQGWKYLNGLERCVLALGPGKGVGMLGSDLGLRPSECHFRLCGESKVGLE